MSYSIRLFEATETDYESVASLYAAAAAPLLDFEHEHSTPALMRHFHNGFGSKLSQLRCYMAFDTATNQLIAVAQSFPLFWLSDPDQYWLMLRVLPQFQGRGIGGELFAFLSAKLAARGARVLLTQAHETTPDVAAWVRGLGFQEAFRSLQLVLDAQRCDDTSLHEHEARAAQANITITTLAEEQRNDPQWLDKLYDLHTSFVRDIPVPDHPNPTPPLPWFAHYACHNPEALPDGFFIAKSDGRYLGESFVQRDADPLVRVLHHKLTGVRPQGRGSGVAMALKLKTIQYARQHGYHQITTWNESTNTRMLSINQKLGFERLTGPIVFQKRLPAVRGAAVLLERAARFGAPLLQ